MKKINDWCMKVIDKLLIDNFGLTLLTAIVMSFTSLALIIFNNLFGG